MNQSQNKQLQRIITKLHQVGGEISNGDAQRIRRRIQYMEGLMNQFNRSLYPDIKYFIHFNTQDLFIITSSFPLMNYTINTEKDGELNEKIPYKPDPNFMFIVENPKNTKISFDEFIENPAIFQPIAPAYLLYHDSLPDKIKEKARNRLLLSLQNQFQIHQQTDYTQCLKKKDYSWFIHQGKQALTQKYETVLSKNTNFIQSFTNLCHNLFRLIKPEQEQTRNKLLEKENTKNLFSQVMEMGEDWKLGTSRVLTSNVKPLMIIYEDSKNTAKTKTKGFILKKGDDLRNDAFVMAAAHLLNDICELNIPTYKVIPVGKVGNESIIKKEKDTYGIIEFIDSNLEPKPLADFHIKEDTKGGAPVNISVKSKTIETFAGRKNISVKNLYNRLFKSNPNNQDNFEKSLIGSILLQWLFGLHDRHSDNMLILNDGRVANIDFNRILNAFRVKDEIKISKDAIIYAPFIFPPEFAYVIAMKYQKENKEEEEKKKKKKKEYNQAMENSAFKHSYWGTLPKFYVNYDRFRRRFRSFANNIYEQIQKIKKNKDTILLYIQLMSYTNNPRFLIEDKSSFINKDAKSTRNFEAMKQHLKNIITESDTINKFGYAYVKSVLDGFEEIQVDDIVLRLYLAMRLTRFDYLYGIHEGAQRLKQKRIYQIYKDISKPFLRK